MAEIDDVRYEVAVANRVLSEVGLATGVLASLGHASLRVPGNPAQFVVKGRGYEIDALALMQPKDMVTCDLEGNWIDGPPGSSQCFEIKMHSAIYKEHPEVNSIVHVHPRYTTMMSVLEKTLVPMCNEGIHLVRTPLPVYPHSKLILTEEDGQGVASTIGDSPAALLRGHGAVTTGTRLEQSVMNMLQLEEQAKRNWYAYCAAGPDYKGIPEADIVEAYAQPTLADLPHFAGGPRATGNAGPGGAWKYYTQLVSKDL
jgi:ribulose-5-phosphate 4-epimerase/fuculose-1-phosphate aldolase